MLYKELWQLYQAIQKIYSKDLYWVVLMAISPMSLRETSREVRGKGYIWNILKDFYSEEIINDMKGMRILGNSRGVIFDLGKKHELVFDSIAKDLTK